MKKQLIEIINKLNKNRYVYFNNYKFDRLIFNIFLCVSLLFLFYVANYYNYDMDYYKCDARYDPSIRCDENPLDEQCAQEKVKLSSYCLNPFYKETSWKNEKYLFSGEYGKKPGKLFNSVSFIIIILLILSFVINHFVYNKGKTIINLEV